MAEPFVGEIRIFAGSYAPIGWVFCDGRALSISSYELLFSLIGNIYGGDGRTNFKVPDLRGNLPIGQGQGLNLSNRTIGQAFGENTVTLTTDNLPSHSHTIQATNNTADNITPGPALTLATISQQPTASNFYDAGSPGLTTKQTFDKDTLSPVGGNLPHGNQMPTLTINYIIATTGYYPTQG